MDSCIWELNTKKTRYIPSCKKGARMSLLSVTWNSICPLCGKPIKLKEGKHEI